MEPKISVIIPVYNTEKYLRKCLNSVVNQTLKEIEIICVDDGSTDSSYTILEEYAQKDSRIQLLQQQNRYAGVARNAGIKIAHGEYLLFLDSDDFFELDMFEKMYEQAQKNDADICICDARAYMHDTEEFVEPQHYLVDSKLPEKDIFNYKDMQDDLFLFVSPAPWNKLFRRKFVIDNQIEFQALKKSNDVYFVYLSLACAERITVVQERLLNYRIGDTGSLQATYVKEEYYFYEALKELRNALIKRKKFADLERSYVNRALSTCLYHLDKIDNKEAFVHMCQTLKTILYELGVIGHTGGYFFVKSNFIRAIEIVEKDPDFLWEKKREKNNEKKSNTIFELNNWEHEKDNENVDGIKISVIIPVYNVEDYLQETLDSVRNQSIRQIEIICVDDGSTDRSLHILEKNASIDMRIKVLKKENGGASSARNQGISVACGKYVYFMDSDDILENKALEYCYQRAEKENLDMVLFSAKSFFETENMQARHGAYNNYYDRFADYSGILSGQEFFCKAVSAAEFKPSACLYLLKKEILDDNQIKFREGIVCEDNLFTSQCLALAQRVRFVNGYFYNRRVRNNSVMTGTSKIHYAYSYYIVIKEFEKFLDANNANIQNLEYEYAAFEQIHRMRKLACNELFEISFDEIKEEAEKKENGVAFYSFVCEWINLQKAFNTVKNREWDYKSRILKMQSKFAEEQEKIVKLRNEISELRGIEKKYKQIVQSIPYRMLRKVLIIPRKIKKH